MRLDIINGDYGLPAILAGACLVFFLLVVLEWQIIGDRPDLSKIGVVNVDQAPGVSTRTSSLGFNLEESDSFAEIVERPLFLEGRKPLEEQPEDAGDTPPSVQASKLKSKLMGVYSGGEGLMALIANSKGEYSSVSIGDEVEGWQVKELYTDHIIFSQGSSSETIKLRKPKPKKLARSARKTRKTNPAVRKKPPVPVATKKN